MICRGSYTEARAERKSQFFSVDPRAGSPLYQTSLLLAERSKTAPTAFNIRDQPNSTPAAYFLIKLLVVFLDIFPSALGMSLKRNVCKSLGLVCLQAQALSVCVYIQARQWNTSSTGGIARLGLESQLLQHFMICSKKIFLKMSWCFSLEIHC